MELTSATTTGDTANLQGPPWDIFNITDNEWRWVGDPERFSYSTNTVAIDAHWYPDASFLFGSMEVESVKIGGETFEGPNTLLAATALSAVLALWLIQSRSYTTTAFFQNFDGQAAIHASSVARGVDVKVLHIESGRSDKAVPATRVMRCRLETAPETRRVLIDDLNADILVQLKRSGAKIGSFGTSSGVAVGGPEFTIEYRLGKTRGFVGVYSLTDGSDVWKMLILLHEFPHSI